MTKNDLYLVLGVPPTATPADLRKAYRELLRRYHPDVYDGPDRKVAEARSREINEAYATLSDPVRRANYDFDQVKPPDPAPTDAEEGSPKTVPSHAGTDEKRWTYGGPDSDGGNVEEEREGGVFGPGAPAAKSARPSYKYPAYVHSRWPSPPRRTRRKGPLSPRVAFAAVFLFLAVTAGILVVVTYPFPQTEHLALGPRVQGEPQYGMVCLQIGSFPAGVRVDVSWTSSGGTTSDATLPPTPVPDVVVSLSVSPYSAVNRTAWNGSLTFTAAGGGYDFWIDQCGGDYWYQAEFTLRYSAPIL